MPPTTPTPQAPTHTLAPSPVPDATAQSTPDRVVRWREDLVTLAEEIERYHPDPYWRVSKAEYQAAFDKLADEIPTLTDEQVIVEISRIVAFTDGHSFMPLFQEAVDFRLYPIRMYQFSDGLYVVAAEPPQAHLAGARVVQIGRLSVEEAWARVKPIIPYDNDMTINLLAPVYLNVPEVLLALDIIDEVDKPGFVLELPDGTQTTLDAAPVSSEGYRNWLATHLMLAGIPAAPEPLWLSRKGEFFWYTLLEDSNTLYIQYNLVWDTAGWAEGQTIADFAKEVDAFATEHKVARTILDLRHNLGGNNSVPMEEVLRDNPYINQPGRLIVLTGRQTFSGAIRFLVNLEQSIDPVLVGEPTGGPANFYAEQNTSVLGNSGIEVLIAKERWQNSTPDDTRQWIEPHIPVALSSADYFGGRDPVLEAALAADNRP